MTGGDSSFTAAVVGASGFGAVHVRELIQAGASRVRIIGRNPDSAKQTARNLSAIYGPAIVPASSIDELIDAPADFISICSPTDLHADHVGVLLPTNAYILVEKPFLWQRDTSSKVLLARCDDLLRQAQGRLTVNQPTARMIESWLSFTAAPKQPRTFSMRYQTRGRYVGQDIAVDLLPHALSAILVLLRERVVTVTDLDINAKQNVWAATFKLGELAVNLEFLQDANSSGSGLSFTIDGQSVRREQRAVSWGLEVSLVSNGESHVIKNPMSIGMSRAIATCRAKKRYDDVKDVSSVMRLMCEILCR